LLGKRLVHLISRKRLSGIITETEAYRGEEDLACHARAGRTKRTEVMYGPAGFAYVYFNYGMHWLLNFVTGETGFPAAVLLRAIFPLEGLEEMEKRRSPQPFKLWCNGPSKLCQALDINGRYNGLNICVPESPIWVEDAFEINAAEITSSPRVGIKNVPEPWRSIPWRFRINHTCFDPEGQLTGC
jgi:DNA-3-methyladenine glycosylase